VSGTDPRDVSLAVPAQANYLVLARLALSAVCRLTPLSPEEVADLKLAVSEAANDYMAEGDGTDQEADGSEDAERSVRFTFRLGDNALEMELHGESGKVQGEERELGRAIIDALMDECTFDEGHTRLVKRLPG
jgi:Histidine kinase-like ATPase domain